MRIGEKKIVKLNTEDSISIEMYGGVNTNQYIIRFCKFNNVIMEKMFVNIEDVIVLFTNTCKYMNNKNKSKVCFNDIPGGCKIKLNNPSKFGFDIIFLINDIQIPVYKKYIGDLHDTLKDIVCTFKGVKV